MIKKYFKYLSSFILLQSVEKRSSDVNTSLEVVYYNGKYLLDSSRANYSFGGLHTVFQRTFSKFKIQKREINSALILGFGGGSVAHILEKEYGKKISIVGVEKDVEVLALAQKYFSLQKYSNLILYNEDAFDFVQHCKDKFDLIVMDVFVDLEVPEKFFEEPFVKALGKYLSDNGILFFNLVISNENNRIKGTKLFELMNEHIGETEWSRVIAQRTENWVFVCNRTLKKKS